MQEIHALYSEIRMLKQEVQALKRLLPNQIGNAVVSLSKEDTGQFPVTQISYLGKPADATVLTPYGLYSRMPKGSLTVLFRLNGQENKKVCIGNVTGNRFLQLEDGEVYVGNPLTESVIKFLKNGDIDINGVADNNITINNNVTVSVGGNRTETISGNQQEDITGNRTETVGGDYTINVTGDAAITCSNLSGTVSGTMTMDVSGTTTFNTPSFVVNGALSVRDNATFLTGGAAISMSNFRTVYNGHTHISNGIGNPTQTPNVNI